MLRRYTENWSRFADVQRIAERPSDTIDTVGDTSKRSCDTEWTGMCSNENGDVRNVKSSAAVGPSALEGTM